MLLEVNKIMDDAYDSFLEKITVSEKSKWQQFLKDLKSDYDLHFFISYENIKVVLSIVIEGGCPTEQERMSIVNKLDEVGIMNYIYDHFRQINLEIEILVQIYQLFF